jgi:predicted Co/Zn/Cd cation transporter (cation efflux family)
MKKSIPYELVAATLMMVGAVLLVFVFYPYINPVQYRIDNHRETAPMSRYIFGTPVSVLILRAAWYFNRKARRLKRDEKDGKHEQKPSA